MPSIPVLVAEMCLSRLDRLPSSYLLLAICRSRVFWQSLFCLSRLNTAVRSLGRSSVEVCPAKRGTLSHCEAKRLSTAVLTHPARRSSFSRDRCPRNMIIARQSVYPSLKYDRYFSDLFFTGI